MRKLIWLLLLFPIFLEKVNANETYYSEYGPYSEFDSNFIFETDVIDVDEEIRYQWYKENKTLGNYELYNKTDTFDESTCYSTEFSSWSDDKPNQYDSIIIDTRKRYEYTMAKEARYLHLTNLYSSYDAIRLPELRVKIDGKEINYQYTCVGCWEGFDNTIHNGVDNVNESYIDNGGSLIIDLGKSYPVNKVELEFYIFDVGERNTDYVLGYSKDKVNIFAKKAFMLSRDIFWSQRIHKRNHYIYDLGLEPKVWQDVTISYTPFMSDYIIDTKEYTEYRYQEKWCQKYNVEREYKEGFYKDSQGEYNNKGASKSYYRYRTRDMIEIVSNLIIEDSNFDIGKFVVSSTKNYDIITNIDYTKNGIYPIVFKMEDIEVNKEVYVKIDDNIIKEYEEKIKELNEKLIHIQEEFKNKNKEQEEKIDQLNIEIIDLQEQLVSCQKDCQDKENCLLQKLQEKDQQLKLYEEEIFKLSNKINDLQVQINNYIEQIAELQGESNQYQYLYQQLLDLQEKMNNDNQKVILVYNKKLQLSENINHVYYEKIKELENQLHNQNSQIGMAIGNKEKMIEELQNKIILMEKMIQNKDEYENKLQTMSKELEERNQETFQLRNKMNDYTLKINGEEKGNLLWIYMGITLFLIGYVTIKKRKKSNVKKG